MKSTKTRKALVSGLNYYLRDELSEARCFHHAYLRAAYGPQRERDVEKEIYCRDRRDEHRRTARVLANILRKDPKTPDDILSMVENFRLEEFLNTL